MYLSFLIVKICITTIIHTLHSLINTSIHNYVLHTYYIHYGNSLRHELVEFLWKLQ